MLDEEKLLIRCTTYMENEKMKLLAYAKLLNRKINSANRKAKNPFIDYEDALNPFGKPFYNTLVWIEADENQPTRFK